MWKMLKHYFNDRTAILNVGKTDLFSKPKEQGRDSIIGFQRMKTPTEERGYIHKSNVDRRAP